MTRMGRPCRWAKAADVLKGSNRGFQNGRRLCPDVIPSTGGALLERTRILRQWKAHEEEDQRHQPVDLERFEGGVVDGVGSPHQLLEADDRGQRRGLDQLYQETDDRRAGDRPRPSLSSRSHQELGRPALDSISRNLA